MLKYKATI